MRGRDDGVLEKSRPSGRQGAKPIFSREGANIRFVVNGRTADRTDGPYAGPLICQQLSRLPRFEGQYYPVIGSWMVNGWACGIGIREDTTPITGNTSRFVPHVVR